MKKTLLAVALLSFAAVPAKAETAFWFTCDFPSADGVAPISFGLYASEENGFVALDPSEDIRPISWLDLGSTTHIYLADVFPETWVLSFNAEEQAAIAYHDGRPIRSTSCRGGAE